MTFNEKLQVARKLIGARIQISGHPTYHPRKPEVGVCTDVVKWPDADHVDFVLENGSRYGMCLEDVSATRCSGDAGALGKFMRTVERLS